MNSTVIILGGIVLVAGGVGIVSYLLPIYLAYKIGQFIITAHKG